MHFSLQTGREIRTVLLDLKCLGVGNTKLRTNRIELLFLHIHIHLSSDFILYLKVGVLLPIIVSVVEWGDMLS